MYSCTLRSVGLTGLVLSAVSWETVSLERSAENAPGAIFEASVFISDLSDATTLVDASLLLSASSLARKYRRPRGTHSLDGQSA